MERIDAMLERLPPIYAIDRGTVLRSFLGVTALALAVFDEDMDRVQRSHWVDHAFDRADLVALGALFEVAPAPWEPDSLYRARLKATVAARLRGSVTRADLELAILRLIDAAQRSLGVRYMTVPPEAPGRPFVFRAGPAARASDPAFVEFPLVRRRSADLVGRAGKLRPLDTFACPNRGTAAASLEAILRGAPGGRTSVPVLVNKRNGTLAAYAGLVRCGQELRLEVGPDGGLRADLDGADVTGRLFTSAAFDPEAPFTPLVPDPAPLPIRLERGDNELWFFTLALYDLPALDVAGLAMPSPDLKQGIFGAMGGGAGTSFDDSVFYQEISLVLDAWWDERAPATFRFEVPAGVVRRERPEGGEPAGDPHGDRTRLFALLEETVEVLRAAAVDGHAVARPFGDEQRAGDRCAVGRPAEREVASAGEDELTALSALFDVRSLEGAPLA